jgi:Ca2+-binding EF-hand superfamily protein
MNAFTKVAALAAVLAVPVAFAQDYPTSPATQSGAQTPSVDYSKLDANGDGSISKSEAKKDASLSANFDSLDKDKNGSLSSAELSSGMTKDR